MRAETETNAEDCVAATAARKGAAEVQQHQQQNQNCNHLYNRMEERQPKQQLSEPCGINVTQKTRTTQLNFGLLRSQSCSGIRDLAMLPCRPSRPKQALRGRSQ